VDFIGEAKKTLDRYPARAAKFTVTFVGQSDAKEGNTDLFFPGLGKKESREGNETWSDVHQGRDLGRAT